MNTASPRAQLCAVAKRAALLKYPIVAWPEDKDLLKLADLPRVGRSGARCPACGLVVAPIREFFARNSHELREQIIPGRAYALLPLGIVAEYEHPRY